MKVLSQRSKTFSNSVINKKLENIITAQKHKQLFSTLERTYWQFYNLNISTWTFFLKKKQLYSLIESLIIWLNSKICFDIRLDKTVLPCWTWQYWIQNQFHISRIGITGQEAFLTSSSTPAVGLICNVFSLVLFNA